MRWPMLLLLLAACSGEPSGAVPTAPTTAFPASSIATTAGPDTTPAPLTSITTSAPTTDVSPASATTAPADIGVVPVGFDRGAAIVTEADGSTCEICVWLATTPSARARGLMEVTDLGAADAMAFVYPDPHTGSFWMKDTVLPLSIAFFAADGSYLDEFDMEPCVTEQCVSYATPADFLIAVEVPQGELADFGMEPGSRLELLDTPCAD